MVDNLNTGYINVPTSGGDNSSNVISVINVLGYGADPTGAADSAAAFQAAFDAADALAPAGLNGPPVQIPTGIYRINSGLTWKSHDIIGDGPFASRINWGGAATGTVITRTGDQARMSGLQFRDDVNAPAIWVDLTGTDADYGDWIEDCFLVGWSTTDGVAAIKATSAINFHMRRLRFGSGKGYAVKVVDPSTLSTISLDDFTVDWNKNASVMSGFFNVEVDDATKTYTLRIANGRIESNAGFGAGEDSLVALTETAAGNMGIVPASILLESLTIQVGGSGLGSLVHQNTSDSFNAASLLFSNIRVSGVNALLGGTFSSQVEQPQGVPSAFIPFMTMGRYNSGAAATAKDNWFMSKLRAMDFHTDVIATASLPAASASEDGRILLEDTGSTINFIAYGNGERVRFTGTEF